MRVLLLWFVYSLIAWIWGFFEGRVFWTGFILALVIDMSWAYIEHKRRGDDNKIPRKEP